MNRKRILLAAGGTGGHFFAAYALAVALADVDYNVYFSTDRRCQKYVDIISEGKDKRIIFGFIDLYIKTGSILAKITAPIKILFAICSAVRLLLNIKPNLLIAFGGYPTVPAIVACKIFGVPIILYEQNTVLGKVNSFFGPSAKLVALACGSPQGLKSRIHGQYVGHIVRSDIVNLRLDNDFSAKLLRVLVLGGSQGARALSKSVTEAIQIIKATHEEFHCIITQQLPNDMQKDTALIYKQLGIKYELVDFFHNICSKYQETDLVICRSGASTVAELSSIGLPAIFVPLPCSTANHQEQNARYIEQLGGAWVILQQVDLAKLLAAKILEIDGNRNMLREASQKILSAKSDGRASMVEIVHRAFD